MKLNSFNTSEDRKFMTRLHNLMTTNHKKVVRVNMNANLANSLISFPYGTGTYRVNGVSVNIFSIISSIPYQNPIPRNMNAITTINPARTASTMLRTLAALSAASSLLENLKW